MGSWFTSPLRPLPLDSSVTSTVSLHMNTATCARWGGGRPGPGAAAGRCVPGGCLPSGGAGRGLAVGRDVVVSTLPPRRNCAARRGWAPLESGQNYRRVMRSMEIRAVLCAILTRDAGGWRPVRLLLSAPVEDVDTVGPVV